MKTKLWKKALWLMFALCLSWGFFPGIGDSAATPKTFTDKLGFFSFTPPEGWVEKDYPGEKVGRVRFTAPDNKATLSIIVGAASAQAITLEQLLADRKMLVEKLRREKPERRYHVSAGTICRFKCVRFDVEIPGQLIQENYLLMEKGLNISFGYTAANQAGLEKYRQTAINSFCTIKLKGEK
jgi:hypothetical protein